MRVSLFFRVLATVSSAAALVLAGGAAAQAAPHGTDNYGFYTPYEGQYPTISACAGSFAGLPTSAASHGTWQGGQITVQLYYSSRCGAYGRITGTPTNQCEVWVSRYAPQNGNETARIYETVDSGLTYAYTKMISNLAGRTAEAFALCGNGTTTPITVVAHSQRY